MFWKQVQIEIDTPGRCVVGVGEQVLAAVPELADLSVGLLHVFLQHTSASLTLNENTDPDVGDDLTDSLRSIAPDGMNYRHNAEGPDDMPAHIKSSLLGASLMIPVANGQLRLGTWQGIFLVEHRNRGGRRRLVLTLAGQR